LKLSQAPDRCFVVIFDILDCVNMLLQIHGLLYDVHIPLGDSKAQFTCLKKVMCCVIK